MRSPRVLGVVALIAILVAATSFAVVDVSIAQGCAEVTCAGGIPIVAITFATVGGLATLASVIPAVSWFVEAIRGVCTSHPDDDREIARAHRPRITYSDNVDEEL